MTEAPKSKTPHQVQVHDDDVEEKHKKCLQFIEDVTSNADEIQNKVLEEILSRNANVEYLRRHGLGGRTDRHAFKNAIPVITYEDVLPDIQRIANGDKSPILCSQPISEFLTSSGTSGGEPKLVPSVEEDHDRRFMISNLVMAVMSQFVSGPDKGKVMYFLFIKSESTTPGGIVARPVSTSSYYKGMQFKNTSNFDPFGNLTSPSETIGCLESYQSMYSQMLCGLCQNKDVIRVGSIFASGFIRAIKFLEQHWQLLCHDIRTGSINPRITDSNVRKAVSRILKPDPELAHFIENECRNESWKGIITRLWPNTKYIDTIVTGSMAQYIPTLSYYGNGLPLVSSVYGSSECYFGINLNPFSNPSDVTYVVIPTMAYFEFLPMNPTNNVVELVDLVDVKLGQEYELIVTTYSGLYRYHVGDILRVAEFKNKAPLFTLLGRKNVALSIDVDKTDEVELHNAVNNVVHHHLPQFNASLIDYTSYADISTTPGHYVIFWETTKIPPPTVLEDCCLAIEELLNKIYRRGRAMDKSIGPLEIRVVENGTFDKLMDYAISQGASLSQYKTPRCVKYAPIIELLNSRVVSSYFSQRCPNWTPDHKIWNKDDEKETKP